MAQVKVSRVVPNITSAKAEETAKFFVDLLGFDIVMDEHAVITLAAAENRSAQINILRSTDPVAWVDNPVLTAPQLSLEVQDVDAVFAAATEQGLDIRYPVTDEGWGVRRFFVAEPNGLVINILSHR
jgi:catechol 2,3-dioxygenase-like lactoylglutathione lyase family enzyme